MPKGVYGNRNWTPRQEAYLLENWGLLPDEAIARRLGRSVWACRIRAKRHLKINRKMNFYSSQQVATIFGVDAHTVLRWVKKGLLNAKKSSVRCGLRLAWMISGTAVERFITRYPWAYDRRRIDRYDYVFHRDLAERAWRRDPYLTLDEAAARLGVNYETVRRHVTRGWLPGHKATWLGNDAGTWLVPESALRGFRLVRPPVRRRVDAA